MQSMFGLAGTGGEGGSLCSTSPRVIIKASTSAWSSCSRLRLCCDRVQSGSPCCNTPHHHQTWYLAKTLHGHLFLVKVLPKNVALFTKYSTPNLTLISFYKHLYKHVFPFLLYCRKKTIYNKERMFIAQSYPRENLFTQRMSVHPWQIPCPTITLCKINPYHQIFIVLSSGSWQKTFQ